MPVIIKQHSTNHPAKLTKTHIVKRAAVEAVTGAVVGGFSGLFGKFGVSIFNPAVAHAAGSFSTFAAVGAIAAPLVFIPTIISDCLIEESEFLNRSPHVKEFVKDTARLALQLGAIASAAAMLSTPIGPTIICMMVIPAIYYMLKSICNLVNAVNAEEPTVPSASIVV